MSGGNCCRMCWIKDGTGKETAMTNANTCTMTLPEFEQLLDVYGGDRTRWPLNARAGAAARLASDAEARLLLAEAVALDTVLAHAPEPDVAATTALADRIVAATRRAPRLVASTEQAAPRVSAASKARVAPGGTQHDLWRGAALVAASLLIGIFVGQSQFGAGAVPALEELTGVSLTSPGVRIALADVHLESVDED